MQRMTNIDSGFVCHCARIRHSELLEIFAESTQPSYQTFKRQYGIGDQCASCEYEVKAILDEHIAGRMSKITRAPSRSLLETCREHSVAARGWLGRVAKNIRSRFSIFRTINARTCMFFIWTNRMRSSLVISNISSPETNLNPNGGSVSCRVRIYNEKGHLFHEVARLKLRANETREICFDDVFAHIAGDFLGSLYVEYYDLTVTNTLRPYCLLNYTGEDNSLRSRQPYHDKFYSERIPGYVQTPSVFMPGRECWVAMTNCGSQDFNATLCLRFRGEVRRATVRFGPRYTAFCSIPKMYGLAVAETSEAAHFWIESDHYVMTYFFWHVLDSDVWIGQHH